LQTVYNVAANNIIGEQKEAIDKFNDIRIDRTLSVAEQQIDVMRFVETLIRQTGIIDEIVAKMRTAGRRASQLIDDGNAVIYKKSYEAEYRRMAELLKVTTPKIIITESEALAKIGSEQRSKFENHARNKLMMRTARQTNLTGRMIKNKLFESVMNENEQIEKAIENSFESVRRNNADRILETNATRISNQGISRVGEDIEKAMSEHDTTGSIGELALALLLLGRAQGKKWVATLDDVTRHAHAHIDGAVVGINEKFETELGEMRYPGDPDGIAENVMNCRCHLEHVLRGLV
jgi:hypothetical protein